MPWTARYNEESQLVEAVCDGVITAEDFRAQLQEAIALALSRDAERFLIDARRMQCGFSVFELVGLVESYEELELSSSTRIAVLQPLATEAAHMMRFYETVARNRAYDVRVFAQREAAEEWLTHGIAGRS